MTSLGEIWVFSLDEKMVLEILRLGVAPVWQKISQQLERRISQQWGKEDLFDEWGFQGSHLASNNSLRLRLIN